MFQKVKIVGIVALFDLLLPCTVFVILIQFGKGIGSGVPSILWENSGERIMVFSQNSS